MIRLSFTIIITLIAVSVMAKNKPTESDIRQSYQEHGALAQLHRWYQFYENKTVGLDNQLGLLTETGSVVLPSGSFNSRNAYAQGVQQLPGHWQHSHELRNVSIDVNDDDTLNLTATITYRNLGTLPDAAVQANTVSYNTTLIQTDTALPVFSQIEITTGEPVETDGFRDLYPENRLLSLIHYWMALVEHPSRNAEPFKELLAPQVAS